MDVSPRDFDIEVFEAFRTYSALELRFVEKKLGSTVVAQALEELEIERSALEGLSDDEVLEMGRQFAEGVYEYNEDYNDMPRNQMVVAEAEFKRKVADLFGEINGYTFSGAFGNSFGIRKGGLFDLSGETDLSVSVEGNEVILSKMRRWINKDTAENHRQELFVTEADKKLLEQALQRFIAINHQLEAEI